MANREERPITYTITQDNGKYRIYTKDARAGKGNMDVRDVDGAILFGFLQFITGTLNNQGFAVLFEVD